ncbi:MAG: ECF-type sigma factor [Verrucomicrobiota bacterium]
MNENSNPEIAVFAQAIQVPPAARTAFLDDACAGDGSLRAKVELLLRAHDQAGNFLEKPPTGAQREGDFLSPIGERPGDRIGRYKLLQQVGEGGCGVVFMAEQEEPVRRRVALKVVKPGMDTKSVIARFESERQALALMEHPNIAQVLDAGATDAGRPYFVMELVRGIKITDYCDQNGLTTSARLELFVQVCHAVQHAHQKGIIHRDLKPSNILVTTSGEGKPLPKVIDFGIAKATTGQQLTDKTVFTAFEMLIGTPAYMSPEQAVLTSVDVDTRTDIYSLGVLLYELLTSTTPFDPRELLKSGLDEIRRVIINEDPIRPSTRLSTMLVTNLTTVAQHRQMEGLKLIRSVRGDLDWIVMKALEKDRTRRYATANGLALDVQRFLADEPISARPPSAAYKLKKLVTRNKVLATGVAVVGALLIAGFGIVSVLLAREQAAHREADHARTHAEADKQIAQAEAAKSKQVTSFLRSMLEGVGPSVAAGRDTQMLREILDQTATRIPAELTNQPAIEAELCFTMGMVYHELGARDAEEKMFRRVLELNRAYLPADSPEIGLTLNRLGIALLFQPNLDEAERQIQASLDLWRKLGHEASLDGVLALENLAMLRWRQERLAEAEVLMHQVYAQRQKLLPEGHPDILNALNNLGNIAHAAKRFAEAEKIYRQVLQAKVQYQGSDHPSLAVTYQNLGWALFEQGKSVEAQDCFARAVQLRRKVLGAEHPNYASSLGSLADVHRASGNYADAETLYREVFKVLRPQCKPGDPALLRTLGNLVAVLSAQKKSSDVESLLTDYLTPEFIGTPESVSVLNLRMEFFARSGRWQAAAADADRAVALQPAEHLHYHALAPLLVASENWDAYRQLCGEIVLRFGDTKDVFVADRMAKDCLIHPAAGTDLPRIAALAEIAVTGGKDHPAFPFFQFCKGLAEYREGHFATAAEWARKAGESAYPLVAVEAKAVLAMAQHQLKEPSAARVSLAKGMTIFETQLPKQESGDLGGDWRDWIIARALLAEARVDRRRDPGRRQPKETMKPELPVLEAGRQPSQLQEGSVSRMIPAPVMEPYARPMSEATIMLNAIERGDPQAADKLLNLVYDELRRLAAYKLSREAPNQTLQPTALVHEAWLKLVGAEERKFEDRNHFFAAAAEAMRRILVDRARRRLTQRHGGSYQRVELEESSLVAPDEDNQLLAVNDALEKLEREYPAQARVVKLRYFAGMTNEEAAQLLGLSVSTIKNYWAFARAWLFSEIKGE